MILNFISANNILILKKLELIIKLKKLRRKLQSLKNKDFGFGKKKFQL